MASRIDFRILGPLEAWLGSQLLEIRGSAQRALLARLLLDANRVVSVEQLIAELWIVPPETGVAALHQRVAKLREALTGKADTPLIVTRGPGYLLRIEPEQFDLHRFEAHVARGEQALAAGDADAAAVALGEALGLWRGRPLAEFPDAPFATPAGARLEEVCLMALERRFEADLVLGRHLRLIPELEAITDEHRFREGFRAQLMLALYRAGRQSEALEAYRQLRSTLVDELGVEPTQALQDLERAILNHDPALDRPSDILAAGAGASPSASPERSILVFPSDERNLEALLGLAGPLTRRPRREIIVTALAATGDELAHLTEVLERQRNALLAAGVSTRAAAFTSASIGSDLVRLVGAQEVDLLLTDAPPELLVEGLPPEALQTVLGEAPCDVATLVPGDRPGEGGIRDIVVPFSGNTHDWAALEIGAWLAASHEATLELLGTDVQPEQGQRDASRLLADVSLAIQRTTGVLAKPRLVAPGEHAVLDATRDAGLVVVGLSERWADEGLGPARLALARSTGPPTLIVRRGVRPGGIAPPDRFTRYTWSLAEARES